MNVFEGHTPTPIYGRPLTAIPLDEVPLPANVPVEVLGDFIHRRQLRIVRSYWSGNKFIVEVAPTTPTIQRKDTDQ